MKNKLEEKYVKLMEELCITENHKVNHILSDDLIHDLLIELEYLKLASIYKSIHKGYN